MRSTLRFHPFPRFRRLVPHLAHLVVLAVAAGVAGGAPAAAEEAPVPEAGTVTKAPTEAQAAYAGTARTARGEVAYIEEHRPEFGENGRIVRSRTTYLDKDRNVIGTLESDFSASLTAPAYVYEDRRTGEIHGIRHTAEAHVLFDREPGKPERTLEIPRKGVPADTLLVGCQGLHYYLVENLDVVRSGKSIPIRFLIPGDLDYYTFNMSYRGTEGGLEKLEIKISNPFLRLFAPSLTVWYDPRTRRLVKYVGLSNIKDDRGDLQSVVIDYLDDVSGR